VAKALQTLSFPLGGEVLRRVDVRLAIVGCDFCSGCPSLR